MFTSCGWELAVNRVKLGNITELADHRPYNDAVPGIISDRLRSCVSEERKYERWLRSERLPNGGLYQSTSGLFHKCVSLVFTIFSLIINVITDDGWLSLCRSKSDKLELSTATKRIVRGWLLALPSPSFFDSPAIDPHRTLSSFSVSLIYTPPIKASPTVC
jgi:hypothetical protein